MIKRIILSDKLMWNLIKRNLIKQYLQAEYFILSWNLKQVNFKSRQPKQHWKYQFRISKQFRAIWIFEWKETFKILEIYDYKR
jgi:hypothetical protein